MGIAVAIAVFLVLAVIAWLVYSGVATNKAAKKASDQEPGDPRVETLEYHVPDGQDPTVVMSALEQQGYTTALDEVRAEKHLVIACPHGREQDRARIRTVIDEADQTSIEGPDVGLGKVVFEDEK
ncbi:MAG TPA: hypothetical protein VHG70_06000 [Nocardioidaceae bacterium]|nr:hypothetical protein [Nocardioidaceae bacterium]